MDYITSADSFFKNVKEDYREYKQSGFFDKSPQEGLYIYRITKEHRSYIGIIACAEVRDFIEGRIKKHEHTLPEKEQRQMHLLLHRNAMVKPILLTYPKVDDIEKISRKVMEEEKPFMEVYFDSSFENHQLWRVSDGADIKHIQELFDKHIEYAYIADGHHRSSTVALMHQRTKNPGKQKAYDKVLTAFFPTTQLEILEYNRIVEGLNDISLSRFMARLSRVCDIEELEGAAKPGGPREIVMYVNKEWYLLKWKPEVLKKYESEEILLDVSLLNHEILEGIIGIVDIRMDDRLKYVEGPKQIEDIREKVLKNDHRIGFILHPVQMEDFLGIADAEKVLPPKSTWFEPRMRNGLIAQEY
ncbi:MAG: DUF1015 domain-containing protein [Bacteroidetes bacterium]|nr:DUF1015 domain-containing protein [Bacteroidota bacterium]